MIEKTATTRLFCRVSITNARGMMVQTRVSEMRCRWFRILISQISCELTCEVLHACVSTRASEVTAERPSPGRRCCLCAICITLLGDDQQGCSSSQWGLLVQWRFDRKRLMGKRVTHREMADALEIEGFGFRGFSAIYASGGTASALGSKANACTTGNGGSAASRGSRIKDKVLLHERTRRQEPTQRQSPPHIPLALAAAAVSHSFGGGSMSHSKATKGHEDEGRRACRRCEHTTLGAPEEGSPAQPVTTRRAFCTALLQQAASHQLAL